MEYNFNGQTTIINSPIGNNNTYHNNTYYNEPLTDDDWKNIEKIFDLSLKEMSNDSYLHSFFNESKKYASNKDKKGLKNFFEKNCTEFIKNVFYNMASTGIIALLSKIGIFI
ncbi:MAG: hypothetical protein K2N80_09545 [Lachnospiraceae bacterium]|nr:hypothetical protein [Lachnospiraceae bacterium]